MTSIRVILPCGSVLHPCATATILGSQIAIADYGTRRLLHIYRAEDWLEATAHDASCRPVYTVRNPDAFSAFAALVETRRQIRAVETTLAALQILGA